MKGEKGEKPAVHTKNRQSQNKEMKTEQTKGSNKISLCQAGKNTDSPNSFSGRKQ